LFILNPKQIHQLYRIYIFQDFPGPHVLISPGSASVPNSTTNPSLHF